MATKTPAKPKLTAQQKRDRDYMQQTANLIAQHEAEQQRTNNEHYTLGLTEGEHLTSYEFSKLSALQFLKWKRQSKKLFNRAR